MELGSWAYWSAVARNPVALTGVVVDLLPIWAVLVWGWDAAALVMLYWLENVVIGVMTVARIVAAWIGRKGLWGIIAGVWASALFILHYGLFNFGHGGILLEVFGRWDDLEGLDTLGGTLTSMLEAALIFAPHMAWVLTVIFAWHIFVFVRDYIIGGVWLTAEPQDVAFEPYGRVIVFHVGVFIVAGALEYFGDPGIGALILVMARVLWGLKANMRFKSNDQTAELAVAV